MNTNEKLDKLFESHGTPLSERYDDPVARYGKDPLNKKENNVVYRQEIKKIENFIAKSMKALVSISKGSSKSYILYVREDYSEFGMKLPDTFSLEDINNAQSNFLSKPSTRRIFETNDSYWRLEPTIGEDEGLRDVPALDLGILSGRHRGGHGRTVEVYYEACMGNTDKAVQMAHDELGEESYQAATKIYEMGGRWKEAFESLRKASDANDSITNVVLMNSMEGFQNELRSYDTEPAPSAWVSSSSCCCCSSLRWAISCSATAAT